MNGKLKQKWLKALRSGEYKQGRLRFRSANQYGSYFCCLGVLKDVAGMKTKSSLDFTNAELKDLGLTVQQQSVLIDKNDIGRQPFTEIADWIEKNVKES